MISFTVSGDPIAQPRHKVSTRGGFAKAYIPKEHPIHAYKEAVRLAAKIAMAGLAPVEGPVSLCVWLYIARPKSHYLKSGLRATAPAFVKCDVDNLLKGILDALAGICYEDDRQVEGALVLKRWGTESFTQVKIW